ncbi:MAG: phosphoenolpyruvate--protein phosphotransferase [Planctomycetes bacterium]|nr:phosphoenolpyruvate--protein phosphotransferase [Planctomycetota bacterium]
MSTTSDTSKKSQTLFGQSVSPGVAYGPVFFNSQSLDFSSDRRLRDNEVESELARVDSVARAARVSLVHQRNQLSGHFTDEQRRVFDTHLTLLEDPTIESDLRSRIEDGRLYFEHALRDVVEVYERLFEVVESEKLRNKLADMRDVALRLVRYAKPASERKKDEDRRGGILVVKELSLSDLTEALDQGLTGIIAEEGNLESHGAILTSAAGIPAILGVGLLQDSLQQGQRVMVDGDNGVITIEPSTEAINSAQGRAPEGGFEIMAPPILSDNSTVHLTAAVASPSEAKQVKGVGINELGLYRTELPVIQRQGRPREDSLSVLYSQVLAVSEKVCFRLPDLKSTSGIQSFYSEEEVNPAMGLRGVRLLREFPDLLKRQLRAILRASENKIARVAVPFVIDAEDISVVRTCAESAREELRLEGFDVPHPIEVGVIIETPSSALLGRELIQCSDFVIVDLDSLAESLIMCERTSNQPSVYDRTRETHPVLLRAVRKLAALSLSFEKELTVCGESLVQEGLAQLLVGVGIRRFAIRPALLRDAHEMLSEMNPEICGRIAEQACRVSTAHELRELLPTSWQ